MTTDLDYHRYFLSYSGARLPLNLVSPIEPGEIQNRNTFFGARVNEDGRICLIHKRVYGDIELAHEYAYHADGALKSADIFSIDDEGVRLTFDAQGNIVERETLPCD